MGIEIKHPIVLLLLLPAFLYFFFTARRYCAVSKWKRGFFTAIRSLVCCLLIFSLAGVQINSKTKQKTTVFAFDLSASAQESVRQTSDFFKEAKNFKPHNEKEGVVIFGKNASIEMKPAEDVPLWDFISYVEEADTNIAEALKVSANILTENTQKRIVLISDGAQNQGNAMDQINKMRAQNIRVDVYPRGKAPEQEVQITNLEVPSYVNKNVSFDIKIKIDSQKDTKSNLTIYRGAQIIINEEIDVRSGRTQLLFSDKVDHGGGVIYRAQITPQEDTYHENNTYYGYSWIGDVPSVLIVQQDNSGSEIQKLLDSSQATVQVVDAPSAPVDVASMSLYNCIILADTEESALPDGFLNALEEYVKTLGGGLVVTGGENSYAMGGYAKTKLEEILPVDMQLKSDGQTPDLGIVLIIDRSGSMTQQDFGMSRIELAKEAVIRSISTLTPEDTVGVIAFDDKPTWVVPMQKVEQNVEQLKEQVASVQPGGGTSILPALQEGAKALAKEDTKLKHIILLTDGEAEKNGYESVINEIRTNGGTLSTVAVSSGADTKLLEQLAQVGNGRYYYSDVFTDLPEIFAKETYLAGKEYINNRSFYPVSGDDNGILNAVEAVEALKGYIGTTAKPRADVILESDTQEPILAAWQYGLGRSAAWTSDMSGKWTQAWLAGQGAQVFRNTVSWAMRRQSQRDIALETERTEGGCIIKLKTSYDKNITTVVGDVVSDENNKESLLFEQSAPGQYHATMDETKEGAYILNLSFENKVGEKESVNTGFNLPYSKEYDFTAGQDGTQLLRRIAQMTGGTVLEKPEDVYQAQTAVVYAQRDISTILLLLGLFLFLLDVAVRRFAFLSDRFELFFNKLLMQKGQHREKKPEKVKVIKEEKRVKQAQELKAEESGTMSALLKNKRKRNQ